MSTSPEHRPVSRARHWGGFVAGGVSALCVDAALLVMLTDGAGMSPFAARLISIAFAMVVSWQINRRVTFAMTSPSSVAEFGRFASVSGIAQIVNYALYALILIVRPATWPVSALVAASLVATLVSYTGYRFAVFRPSAKER